MKHNLSVSILKFDTPAPKLCCAPCRCGEVSAPSRWRPSTSSWWLSMTTSWYVMLLSFTLEFRLEIRSSASSAQRGCVLVITAKCFLFVFFNSLCHLAFCFSLCSSTVQPPRRRTLPKQWWTWPTRSVHSLFVCFLVYLFIYPLMYSSVSLPLMSLCSLVLGGTRSTRSSSTLALCWWPWTPGLRRTWSQWATTLCSHCGTSWSTARRASGSAVTPSTFSRRRSPSFSSSSPDSSSSSSSLFFYSHHCLLHHFPPIYTLPLFICTSSPPSSAFFLLPSFFPCRHHCWLWSYFASSSRLS